jgi:hypothetical protein
MSPHNCRHSVYGKLETNNISFLKMCEAWSAQEGTGAGASILHSFTETEEHPRRHQHSPEAPSPGRVGRE